MFDAQSPSPLCALPTVSARRVWLEPDVGSSGELLAQYHAASHAPPCRRGYADMNRDIGFCPAVPFPRTSSHSLRGVAAFLEAIVPSIAGCRSLTWTVEQIILLVSVAIVIYKHERRFGPVFRQGVVGICMNCHSTLSLQDQGFYPGG